MTIQQVYDVRCHVPAHVSCCYKADKLNEVSEYDNSDNSPRKATAPGTHVHGAQGCQKMQLSFQLRVASSKNRGAPPAFAAEY